MDIGTVFHQVADRHPERTALVFEDRRWTYAEWHGRVMRFAQALADIGVRPGDRVAFQVSTSENSATSYFACQVLGAVAVPLNFRLSLGEVTFVLRDSGARVFIYASYLVDIALEVQSRLRSTHDYINCALDQSVVPPGHHHFDTLVEDTVDRGLQQPVSGDQELSALVYTSGTTGRPKGVMHGHANDVAIAMNCVMEYGLTHNDVALHVAPLYHVGGMQAFFIPHMMVGGANVVLGRYEATTALEAIQAERVTTLFAVPVQIQEMLGHPRFAEFDVRSLRMITTGGAAISAATIERTIRAFCPNIFNGYGMTEASLTLLLHPEDALSHLGSCGKPTLISGCRIVANDPTRDVPPSEIVAPDEIGQLIVRGPQVMLGYWNNAFETARKVKAGWLYTGDLMSRDTAGYYHFHGRADDMIVSGGENIYPREVEEVLFRCPGVADAAVVGLPDPRWGEAVTAFVVKGDPALDAEAIDAHFCGSRELAAFKRPRHVEFVESLPRNPSGKVVKRDLLAAYTATR